MPQFRSLPLAAPRPTAPNMPPTPARLAWLDGNQLFVQKKFAEAFAVYARALQSAPRDAALWFALGAASASLKNSPQAKAAFLKALSLQPHFPEALLSLGNEIYHDGNFLGAASTYLRAILQRPRYSKAHCNLGNALSGLRRYDEAVRCYLYALKLSPDMSAASHNLGNAYLKQREFPQAQQCFLAALEQDPHSAQLYNSLGNALLKQDQYAEAEAAYRRSISLDPDYSAAHTNLANSLLDQLPRRNRYAEMLRHYHQAITLDPKSAGGQYNLALACLRAGNFREGWQRYRWRWDFRDLNLTRRNFKQPECTREALPSLAGKTLLIHAEQGMGDTLQFLRYLPPLKQFGARVLLEVQPRLHRLLFSTENKALHGASEVIAKGDRIPAFDLLCPMMTLPALLDSTLATLPNKTPYLAAPEEQIAAAWKKYPRKPGKRRIGLAWQGNLQSKSNLRRSTTLAALLPLFDHNQAAFYSLQQGEAAKEIAQLNLQNAIQNASQHDEEFSQAAALISTLDLVITVDTSIAHLAGALGKPTWILLPHRGDWRWLDQNQPQWRTRTPWYPKARLFRQPAENDWAAVVGTLHRALHEFCADDK